MLFWKVRAAKKTAMLARSHMARHLNPTFPEGTVAECALAQTGLSFYLKLCSLFFLYLWPLFGLLFRIFSQFFLLEGLGWGLGGGVSS